MFRLITIFAVLVLPCTAAAESYCPKGNLLKRKRTKASKHLSYAHRLTDNKMMVEGSTWNGPKSAIFKTSKAYVTYDLKKVTTVRGLLVQGDNNDTYEVAASMDGKTFTPIWTVPKHPRQGLRLRLKQGLDVKARYLRLGNGQGDKAYSITEFQAFCQAQPLWPPNIEIINDAKGKKKSGKDKRKVRMAFKKITVAILGLITFLGLLYRRKRPESDAVGIWIMSAGFCLTVFMMWASWHEFKTFARTPMVVASIFFGLTTLWQIWLLLRRWQSKVWHRRVETWALVVIAFTGGSNFLSYGTFHGSRSIHYWDSFHYYVGSKYFPENGYKNIYNCTIIAELDDGRESEFETRKVRNLDNNVAGEATDVAKKFVDECRAAFKTPERWADFRQDLRLFRAHMGKDWWQKMFKDHGFNASPVWSMVGVPVANNFLTTPPPPAELVNSPANLKGKNAKQRKAINKRFKADKEKFERRIGSFALFDAACYVGLFLMIWWAFGLWGLAFSILVFGVGYPWAYFWTGGSFGRAPWLLMSVAGVCLFKRGFPLLGGFGITWAMLLRVFPGALIFGVTIKMAWSILTKRRLSRTHIRIIVGCTLGVLVLVGGSMSYFGGTQVYQDFLSNSFKHNDTKLTNHMGLPTLISYHPSYIARKARDNSKKDPFKKWKDMRRKLKKDRLWLHALMLIAFVGMLGYIGRRMEDWEVTALSTVFIVGIFELTCYYYSFLLLMALVAARRAIYAIAMIAMVVGGQIIRLSFGWYDEQYTWETLLVVLAQVTILVGLCIETYMADKKDKLTASYGTSVQPSAIMAAQPTPQPELESDETVRPPISNGGVEDLGITEDDEEAERPPRNDPDPEPQPA